jgi:endogenous inhibitor of DNA gyrase (YacG/DUF329 family)
MAQPVVTEKCAKCGRRLPRPSFAPAYCDKCELIDALLVERYTTHVRAEEDPG